MNILILTPDRVGSTLLQRILTVYMLRKGFDKPVINLHELTNGLQKYYNTTLNQEVLGRPKKGGYYQTLNEIQHLLESVDHYKTSRLAHYHLIRRQDSIIEQGDFYNYLNKNFYIISARRQNLFEHALSWAIYSHSKHLNVYSPLEKLDIFKEIYDKKINIPREFLLSKLDAYKEYVIWAERYFDIQSYFNYEDSINNLEQYILSLDFMAGAEKNSWADMFNQTFDDYNKFHKLIPDLALYKATDNDLSLLVNREQYLKLQGSDWPAFENLTKETLEKVPEEIKKEIISWFPSAFPVLDHSSNLLPKVSSFIKEQLTSYKNTQSQLNKLVENGFLVTNIPIKLQTLAEKKDIINNFDQCIEWYNNWVTDNNFGSYFTDDVMSNLIMAESKKFNYIPDFFKLLS